MLIADGLGDGGAEVRLVQRGTVLEALPMACAACNVCMSSAPWPSEIVGDNTNLARK